MTEHSFWSVYTSDCRWWNFNNIMFSGCLWVSVWVYAPVRVFQTLLTVSWKVLDVFSPNYQLWCILGQRWTCQFWGSKVKVLAWPRALWVEAYRAWRCASSYSLSFTFLTISCIESVIWHWFVFVGFEAEWSECYDGRLSSKETI